MTSRVGAALDRAASLLRDADYLLVATGMIFFHLFWNKNADLLKEILVATGAGFSADSGLAVYNVIITANPQTLLNLLTLLPTYSTNPTSPTKPD
jgi:hypothetical protein